VVEADSAGKEEEKAMSETEQKAPSETAKPSFEVTHSPTIGELVKALAKAQQTFKPVLKQVDNEAFKRNGKASKYADLAEYIDATQESLAKNELVVMQWPDVSPDAKTMTIESLLCHGSGEWMRGRLTLPALGRDGFTAQSCGSSITYGRRYSYAAITGCASQDDDGNAASGRGSTDESQETGSRKAKAAKDRLDHAKSVDCLFYAFPEAHNGHQVELINLKSYGEAQNEVAQDGLRLILKQFQVKGTAGGGGLLSSSMLDALLKELTDAGVVTKELKSNGSTS
jgi:hypothetical protein